MKKIVKRISIITGIMLIIVVGLHIAFLAFINAKGRGLIVKGLKDNFGLEAAMSSLSLKFPFNVEIKDFKCEALSFKKANVSLGFFNPFTRNISLRKVYLDGLDLSVIKNRSGISLDLPSVNESGVKRGVVPVRVGSGHGNPNAAVKPDSKKDKHGFKKKEFSFAIGNIRVENSRIEVKCSAKKEPFDVIFSDFFLMVKGFTYPKVNKFHIRAGAVLVSSFHKSQRANTLSIKGWVDYSRRNMDVGINIDNFDYIAFGKAYPPFWRPNNLRLKEAVLSFVSNLKSKDNNLIIDSLLTVERVKFIEEEGGGESFQAKTLKTAIGFFNGGKEKPSLHFKVITNMDSPKLDFSSLRKSLAGAAGIGPLTVIQGAADKIKTKIEDLGSTTVGSVIETLKGAAGTFGDILKTNKFQNGKENASEDGKIPQE